MVEGQRLAPERWSVRADRQPGRLRRVAAGDGLGQPREQGQVGGADDAAPGVAVWPAEGGELLEVPAHLGHAGLLRELAHRSLGQALPLGDEAAGQRQLPAERLHAAADGEHGEGALAHREDDEVDGDGSGESEGGHAAHSNHQLDEKSLGGLSSF